MPGVGTPVGRTLGSKSKVGNLPLPLVARIQNYVSANTMVNPATVIRLDVSMNIATAMDESNSVADIDHDIVDL